MLHDKQTSPFPSIDFHPLTPHHPCTLNRYVLVYMHTIIAMLSSSPAASGHSGGAVWRSLWLLISFLLLEPPELGLDGNGCLLSLRVFHVNVKVLWDICLGCIWKSKKRRVWCHVLRLVFAAIGCRPISSAYFSNVLFSCSWLFFRS